MPDLKSRACLAALLALSSVTISACGGSPATERLNAEPAPVVQTRTVERLVCPTALEQPLGAWPARPAGSLTASTPALMAWVGDMFARTGLLEAVVADASAECAGRTAGGEAVG